MEQVQGTFTSVRNLKVFYQGWVPEKKPKAVILLVHGVGEYCARYSNVVDYFVPQGYAVYGLDHIGHGHSEGAREMIDRFEDFTAPLNTFFTMVKSWQPDLPIFIYGHSLGGLITSFYLLDHQDDFKGAIISAPPVKVPDNISPLTVKVSKLLSKIAPSAGFIGLDTSNLSHDPAVVAAYNADPLVFHGKMPVRISAEMLRAMLRVQAEAATIMLPLFILQGTGDQIVDPAGAKMLFDKVSSTDKVLKSYEGLYHEVHNEPEREIMFKDLEVWLKAHI